MAKFFVGQLVRLVKVFHPENQGREARIVAFFDECESSVEGWPVNCIVDGANKGTANHTDRLEPILPEGAQPLGYSFEQMMSDFSVMEAVK